MKTGSVDSIRVATLEHGQSILRAAHTQLSVLTPAIPLELDDDGRDGDRQALQKELDELVNRLQQKTASATGFSDFFAGAKIDETTLDEQLDLVEKEATELQREIEHTSRICGGRPDVTIAIRRGVA